MEIKIDTLHSRLDSMQLDSQAKHSDVKPLSNVERQIFLVLYTAGKFLSYNEISERSKIAVTCGPGLITSLMVFCDLNSLRYEDTSTNSAFGNIDVSESNDETVQVFLLMPILVNLGFAKLVLQSFGKS